MSKTLVNVVCHSRRRIVHDGYTPGDEFLDYYMPELLDGEHYHVDGQIRDEVYEYGSFLQSRMYREGVRCTDCHLPSLPSSKGPVRAYSDLLIHFMGDNLVDKIKFGEAPCRIRRPAP